MRWLRRLVGLDFPDPQVGQVWRSQNSGRALVVDSVEPDDCGNGWHVGLQYEARAMRSPDGYAPQPIPQEWYCTPGIWRRMLREERRVLEIV